MPHTRPDLHAYRSLRGCLYRQLAFWKAYDKLGMGTVYSRRRCLESFLRYRRQLAPQLVTPLATQLRRSLHDNAN